MRDNVTIAIIAPTQPEDFFDLLWQGVWEATFDLAAFGVDVQNLAARRAHVEEQRRILEALLESRPDAIALSPVHASALNDLIARHVRRGTPVITFHSDAPDSERSAFVRPDLEQAGALAGEVLCKLMHGSGRVLSFPGSPDEFHLAQRYRGLRAVLRRRAAHIQETSHSFEPGALVDEVRKLLRSGERVAGYYVGSEDLVAIAREIEEAARELGVRAPCVGFSNTEQVRPLLESGAVSAVIDESRYQAGYFAVQKAYEAVLKREAGGPVASVQIPATVVCAANACEGADSLGSAFELLIRQRTEILVSYKRSLEEANAKLMALAVTDPLTGLFNRREFEEALEKAVAHARRYGCVTLLAIDLDHFKEVNDRFGHQTGDDVLKAVAQVIQSSCRSTDTCARLGGDEFAVILPHADASAAQVVRRRIGQRIAGAEVATAEGPLAIMLSIGLASVPEDAGSAAELMAAADRAMYQAKQSHHQGVLAMSTQSRNVLFPAK